MFATFPIFVYQFGKFKIEKDIFMQYSHDYSYCIFSKQKLLSHRLNNSEEEIKSGILYDKDYIAMAKDSAVSFDIGKLSLYYFHL